MVLRMLSTDTKTRHVCTRLSCIFHPAHVVWLIITVLFIISNKYDDDFHHTVGLINVMHLHVIRLMIVEYLPVDYSSMQQQTKYSSRDAVRVCRSSLQRDTLTSTTSSADFFVAVAVFVALPRITHASRVRRPYYRRCTRPTGPHVATTNGLIWISERVNLLPATRAPSLGTDWHLPLTSASGTVWSLPRISPCGFILPPPFSSLPSPFLLFPLSSPLISPFNSFPTLLSSPLFLGLVMLGFGLGLGFKAQWRSVP